MSPNYQDLERTEVYRHGGEIASQIKSTQQWCSLKSTGVAIGPGLWETVSMSEKRTKADKAQRQADQLDKKARHPAGKKKKTPREDLSQAATQIVREATENH